MSDALPQKLYFRIGEVAGIVGVEPHVLRYWEREFRSIRPTKSARGQRVYSRRDVENLLRVRELLYTQGFTIAGARKQLQRAPSSMAAARPDETPSAPHVDASDGDGDGKPPVVIASPDEPPRDEPPDPHDESFRGTLSALRDEVSAFLDELGG